MVGGERPVSGATRRACSTSICCSTGGAAFPSRSSSYLIHACTSAPSYCARSSTSHRRRRSPAAVRRGAGSCGPAASASRALEPPFGVRLARPAMELAKCRYVVVEGPIGAGKTSLAQSLAHYLGADALLDEPADNPF